MNANLQERFGRSRKAFKEEIGQVELWALPQRLNLKVREYFENNDKKSGGGDWLNRPEIPTSEEILYVDVDSSSNSSAGVPINHLKGSWESKEAYLSTHYEMLREDATLRLRQAVSQVKMTPTANEEAFAGAIGIYEKVHICGVTCSSRGIATRVTFSLFRTGKKVLWDQSKRLITGGLVVLTPRKDPFNGKVIVATIAARPLAGLQQSPPEIDLFIARSEEQEIDPAEEYLLVEDRGSLYEANRHTLLALQRMIKEPFPLSEHLVNVQASILPPTYLEKAPFKDLSCVLINNKLQSYNKVDIIEDWPAHPQSEMDASQIEALRRILTKRLAIVQGPPGTGKTHVSVQVIKVLLSNRKEGDAPILIACQTNHAIDQILRHIAQFELEFIRLGGRSKDQEAIKARTLYEVRKSISRNRLPGSLLQNGKKKMAQLSKDIGVLLSPLQSTKLPMDFRALERFGLLTERQANTLEAGASQWVQGHLSNPREAQSPFTVWLGTSLKIVPPKSLPEEFGFDYEEADLGFEQLKEMEAENVAKDDEDFETLSGNHFEIADNFTCSKGMSEAKVVEMLKEQDMWKIAEANRPAVYRYLQAELKRTILSSFREKTKEYNKHAADAKIGYWEHDENLLKDPKIIGMTTTGLGKYRGLIAALEPKIVLIEEAAETLEAPVTVACLPSLQHLILVGDHQQLRPHCHTKELEIRGLNVSLFERLVQNDVGYSTLSKQRRMIPEIRRLLRPIYQNLIQDHHSVLDPEKRPDVPGMGGVNSCFFTHRWPEQRDEQMSAFNQLEAEMIVNFVQYLVYNGVPSEDITILTFYNGQRKRILKQLRERVSLGLQRFTVVTVDSYQGEENKIVLLSLVRSNDKGQIGFLDITNRVCVALSRAQCGFYIFGNGYLLYNNKIWKKVIKILTNSTVEKDKLQQEPTMRIAEQLTVTCSNHGNPTTIGSPDDLENLVGGCTLKCNGDLLCGHPCDLLCHPFPHEDIICQQRCINELECGHQCNALCGETCDCKICSKAFARTKVVQETVEPFDGKETLSQGSSAGSWNSFAKEEPGRYAVAASALPSREVSPPKKEDALALGDVAATEVTEKMQMTSFGFDGAGSRSNSSSLLTLVDEKLVANGTRVKRKEKLSTDSSNETVKAKVKQDWSNETSLLD